MDDGLEQILSHITPSPQPKRVKKELKKWLIHQLAAVVAGTTTTILPAEFLGRCEE